MMGDRNDMPEAFGDRAFDDVTAVIARVRAWHEHGRAISLDQVQHALQRMAGVAAGDTARRRGLAVDLAALALAYGLQDSKTSEAIE